MTPFKILVIGKAGSGKSSFCTFLRSFLPDSCHASTSDTLIGLLSIERGVSEQEIRLNKEIYRPELIQMGNDLEALKPGVLAMIPLMANKKKSWIIIDGVRRRNEYDKVRSLFNLVIWVERIGHHPPPDNLELSEEDSDYMVMNHSNLPQLKNAAECTAMAIVKKK